jgi:monoamine oxidase
MNLKSRVVIVGAGASGLQCANRLVTHYGCPPEDIIILEARNRIGGRIYTTKEQRKTIIAGNGALENNQYQQHQEQEQGVDFQFTLDHGAAWVHGTGIEWNESMEQYRTVSQPIPNPMMELLQQSTPEGETVYTHHLHNTVGGNPWMRPNHILHQSNQLAVFVNGILVDNESHTVHHALRQHYTILQQVSQLGNDLFNQGLGMETVKMSLQDAISRVLIEQQQVQKVPHDDETVNVDHDVSLALVSFYRHMLECWNGSCASKLQLSAFTDAKNDDDDNVDGENIVWDDATYKEEGDFYGPHCTVKTGMSSVLSPLLQNGVSDCIMLNQAVTKITQLQQHEQKSPSKIENPVKHPKITSATPSLPSPAIPSRIVLSTDTGLKIDAEYCVVTIPVGCLQDNWDSLFEPSLSVEKKTALQHTKMGSYKKVFLTFDTIFWPTNVAFMGLVRNKSSSIPSSRSTTSPIGDVLLIDNLWSRDDIPCMEAILFGTAGEWAIHKDDAEIQKEVLEFIYDSFPIINEMEEKEGATAVTKDRYVCTDCHITRWEEDPYSRGAYTSMTLGATESHTDELNRPEWDGRLFFSGEATISEYEGSVHAALFSGINAADKIMQRLKLSKNPV